MPKYRKKPVIIEAKQFVVENNGDWLVHNYDENKTGHNAMEIAEWIGDMNIVVTFHCDGFVEIDIPTLEGTMKAVPNDWIIKGVNNEFYPCKPDIFEKTYELVEE